MAQTYHLLYKTIQYVIAFVLGSKTQGDERSLVLAARQGEEAIPLIVRGEIPRFARNDSKRCS